MKYIKGDLIKAALRCEYDVIAQGCNCMNTMGKGLALQMKTVFPEAYHVDKLTDKADINKLGRISSVRITLHNHQGRMHRLTIVNCYIQLRYSNFEEVVNYDAIESCFNIMKHEFSGKRIAIPKIGAGLAGGDWDRIETIINNIMVDEDITVIEYENKRI